MAMKSLLYDLHKELNAHFTEFAGFEVPLQYTSIKEEHLTVRKSVGVFDISHMSNIWVTGREAEELISLTTVEDASRIDNGKGQYSVILREDGTIIDDIIFMNLWKKFMLIPNAGMGKIVTDWLNYNAKKYKIDAKAEDASREYAILAIQGPRSRDTLQKLTAVDLKTLGPFACQYAEVSGVRCIISHTGYTGELGFELQITPTKLAEKVFKDILEAGKEFDIKPIGLGARDTLRLEKCFMLACNEFKGGRTPLEATLSWTINWEHEFIGREALLKQKEKGDYKRLTCLKCIEKAVPRQGYKIEKDGKEVGIVTSGTLSPCINVGIAMGYVAPEFREKGTILNIIVRDKPVKAVVVKPPFVPKDWAQQNV